MRPADLHTDTARLRNAFEELQRAWDETSDQWNDQVSRQFCESYLVPLGPAVKQTLDAAGRMAQLADQAYRDCSE